MAGGAAVDRRAAPIGILRDMRSDRFVAQFHDKVAGVVALIGTQGDRLRPIGMRLDQCQRRQPLGMARRAGRQRTDDQAVAVLHQRMAEKIQPRLLARSLAVETRIGIGDRAMRVVGPALAVEVLFAIAPRPRRLARAILGTKALGLAQASSNAPSTEK